MNEKLDLDRDHVRADVFLRTESVRGQALEDMEQAEIAKALPQSKFYRENASADAESDDASIAIGIESDNGGLKQGSEVIELTQNLGEERARATTEGDTPDETVEEWNPWSPSTKKRFSSIAKSTGSY